MAEMKMKYFSIGDLKKVIEGLDDVVPVLSAPLNDKIRVALDMNVVEKGKFGDYEGKIVIFNTELIDIASGMKIVLSGEKENTGETKSEDEQGNN